jgi:dihydropteroate synthase
MAATCASLNCGVVLMHTRGRPQQWRTLPALAPDEVLPLVLRELEVRVHAALAAGIARDAIVLDPGFGFGKAFDENFPLLAHLDALHALGFPLLAGLSRKGFLRRISQQEDQPGAPGTGSPASSARWGGDLDSETWVPTTAANTAAILAGAHILRVHDVHPARETADLADRILSAESNET